MTVEYRVEDDDQPLGYRTVYVSADNPLPVSITGGSAGGPVTADDVTIDEETTLADYVTANDTAVQSAALTATWGQVANRPSAYTPATHTHEIADIAGLQAIITDLTDRIAALENPEPEEG